MCVCVCVCVCVRALPLIRYMFATYESYQDILCHCSFLSAHVHRSS